MQCQYATFSSPNRPFRPILVRANHFPVRIGLKSAWHYDVKFQTPFRNGGRSSAAFKRLFSRCFEELKRSAGAQRFPLPCGVIFDGLSNAFSTSRLPFGAGDAFEGAVEVREAEDLPRTVRIGVKMQLVGEVDVQAALEEYCRSGSTARRPLEATRYVHIDKR